MYIKQYTIKEEHIDFQGIMDGLYYPFYMEECRHAFIKEILGIDLEEYAKQGLNLVLAEYTLKFKQSLKKGDQIEVTCEAAPIENSRSKFGFFQKILLNGKSAAEASFVATCVPAQGGRPFIPQAILDTFNIVRS